MTDIKHTDPQLMIDFVPILIWIKMRLR